MIYNTNMKVGHLLENAKAEEVVNAFLPGVLNAVRNKSQALELSVAQLVRYSRIPGADQVLLRIDEALESLNTPENRISASERTLIESFLKLDEEDRRRIHGKPCHHQDAVYPGQVWLDRCGQRIQAHGGAVIHENGVYYWYGENKEHTDGKNGIWTWGIKVYSSTDLYNWEDRGFLIPPVLDNPDSPLFPTKRIDRPHILRCSATGKYVCWIKLSGPEAAFTIWQSDELLGPYEMVSELYNPGGYKIGDFDLMADESTGKGYVCFDADHSAMLCMLLSDDYLSAESVVSRSYSGLKPPFTREAPALFEYRGRKYMITSGMSGYVPNLSDYGAAKDWDCSFLSIGNPHVDDPSRASFNSQISKVFRVEGKEGLFIAMADRWLPEYPVDAARADMFTRTIAGTYDRENYHASDREREEMYQAISSEKANTSIADYVWLPFRMTESSDGQCPEIRIVWQDRWKTDEETAE